MPKVAPSARRGRPRTAPAPAPERAPLVLTPEPELPSGPEVLESILEQFGGDGGLTVAVERKRGTRGAAGYLGTHDVTDGLLEEVKSRYGGGEYRGRVYQNGKYATSINFIVAGPPRDVANAGGDEHAELTPLAATLAAIMDTQRAMLDELRRPRESKASGVDDVVSIARAIKELSPAPAPVPVVAAAAAADPLGQFETFLRLRELIAGDAPNAGGGTDWSAVIKEGVHPLIDTIREKIALDREQMLSRRRPAATALVAPAARSAPATPLAALVAELPAFARSYLAGCAEADKDPALYAETVLDAVPSDYVDGDPARGLPPLAELLAADDAAAQLVAAVPEWAPHVEWIGQLVTALRMSLADDAADPERT